MLARGRRPIPMGWAEDRPAGKRPAVGKPSADSPGSDCREPGTQEVVGPQVGCKAAVVHPAPVPPNPGRFGAGPPPGESIGAARQTERPGSVPQAIPAGCLRARRGPARRRNRGRRCRWVPHSGRSGTSGEQPCCDGSSQRPGAEWEGLTRMPGEPSVPTDRPLSSRPGCSANYFGDLAGPNARGAHVNPLRRTADQRAHTLNIRVPPPLGAPVGVADAHPKRGMLAAYLTHRCHLPLHLPVRPALTAHGRRSRSDCYRTGQVSIR